MTKKEQAQLTKNIRETMAIVKSSKEAEKQRNTTFMVQEDGLESLFPDEEIMPPKRVSSKPKSVTQLLIRIFFLVTFTIFLFSTYKVVRYFVDEFIAQQTQREVRHKYTVAAQHKNMTVPEQSTMHVVELLKPLILTDSAKELLQINEDVVGYIRLPNTGIQGAVVQGEDDEYYLNHDINGKPNQGGTIFVDSRALIGTHYDSPNLILYGHNQKDGTMFGDMDFFRWNTAYWQSNPIIYFNTNYENRAYLIIASFVTNELPEHDNGYVFDYWNYIYFNQDFPFEKWKSEVLDRTTFTTGYDFTEYDQYITLSTCSTEWEPSRHVIIARLLRANETVDNIDTSMWEENPNPRWPQIWYDYHGGGEWKRKEEST